MAVSNAIGSSIFDVTIALALPALLFSIFEQKSVFFQLEKNLIVSYRNFLETFECLSQSLRRDIVNSKVKSISISSNSY